MARERTDNLLATLVTFGDCNHLIKTWWAMTGSVRPTIDFIDPRLLSPKNKAAHSGAGYQLTSPTFFTPPQHGRAG